ncbi:MAG: DUF971 domain-containing protein [Bacteroidetes bacterium]|nr:DUF971 domain-containing protein [Bacteroidota bacterium]MBU1677366.1 DUF971 domain-containing protein [Bacteroidota bacterium]MBU2505585.1 DUF971 domain-containing protein [Bacteroidota bacterium]
MAVPKNIKLNKQETLLIQWDNGKENIYPLKFLRDESPDANNKGETILWKHYSPPFKSPDKPGKYEIADIQMVGNYAIQITWKDGYDYGIYSWQILEQLGDYLALKTSLKDQ